MGIQQIENVTEFKEKVLQPNNDKIVILHLCFPKIREYLAPQLEVISDAYPAVHCYEVNVSGVKNIRDVINIRALPAVIVYKNGERLGEIWGNISPSMLKDAILRFIPSKERPVEADRGVDIDPGSCQICHMERIAKLFSSHPDDRVSRVRHRVSLHKLTANAETCNYCRFLTQTCQRDAALFRDLDEAGGEVILKTTRDIGVANLHLDGFFKGRSKNMKRFNSRVLQLTGTCDLKDISTHFSGRTVQTEADLGLCLSWLATCRKYHASDCRPKTMDPTEMGLRLIDIKTQSIINAPKDARYTALSYVWGGVKQLVLNDDTFQRLTSLGGLSDKHPDVPRTIRDAMAVASSLGFEYLWVDALCIKQDDDLDKKRQIENMDRVYNCASLTIVSTGPNPLVEIPGLRRASRAPNQAVCRVGDVQLINTLPTLSQALSASPWDSRGWTLQEKALSKRLLIFTEFQVYWHCDSAVYAEDTCLELSMRARTVDEDHRTLEEIVETYDEMSKGIYKISPEHSPQYQYVRLLGSYKTRDLTNQGDALNAFTGVLNSFKLKLGTHHWGLPTRIFTPAMLWKCNSHLPEGRRKQFPSWSWVGWEDKYVGGEVLGSESKISWWRFDDAGALVSINPGKEDPAYTNEFFGVDSTLPPPHSNQIPSDYSTDRPDTPDRSHILRFWTSEAPLSIGRTPLAAQSKSYAKYPVFIPGQTKRFSTVILDKTWRDAHEDRIDAIFLSYAGVPYKVEGEDLLWVMLIERDNDIAYRVQYLESPIRLANWKSAKPQFKVITLA